jgi:hypothetical protein
MELANNRFNLTHALGIVKSLSHIYQKELIRKLYGMINNNPYTAYCKYKPYRVYY